MRGEEFYRGIFRYLSIYSGEIEFWAVVEGKRKSLTRFANNGIHQNMMTERAGLAILGLKGNRVAMVKTDRLDEEGIRASFDVLKEVLEVSRALEYEFRFPSPQVVPSYSAYDLETAEFSPIQRAEAVKTMVGKASERSMKAFGHLSTGEIEWAIMSSNGHFLYFQESTASMNLVVEKEGNSGYVSWSGMKIKDCDFEKLADRAIETALKSSAPVEIPPGRYTVILSPEAVADMVVLFAWVACNGKSFEEKRSPAVKYLGQKIGIDSLNIMDDPSCDQTIPVPFDLFGFPREPFSIVENGVFKQVTYSYPAAIKFGKQPTGHTFNMETLEDSFPVNLVVFAGDTTLEDMIKDTDRGVYISRFHYTNIVNPMELVITGMTRDGTFLIENGEITRSVKNMRFNFNFFEMMKNVDMISREREAIACEHLDNLPVVAPYMRIHEFPFISASDH